MSERTTNIFAAAAVRSVCVL